MSVPLCYCIILQMYLLSHNIRHFQTSTCAKHLLIMRGTKISVIWSPETTYHVSILAGDWIPTRLPAVCFWNSVSSTMSLDAEVKGVKKTNHLRPLHLCRDKVTSKFDYFPIILSLNSCADSSDSMRTNSMEHTPFWEANGSSDFQENYTHFTETEIPLSFPQQHSTRPYNEPDKSAQYPPTRLLNPFHYYPVIYIYIFHVVLSFMFPYKNSACISRVP